MNKYLTTACALALAVSPFSASAAFTPDEFDGTELSGQWTFVDSHDPGGSTYTLTGDHFQLTAPEGTDFYYFVDEQAFIEQDAPSGENWEIVTKIDNWDPTQAGQQRQFIRSGMQLWQDDNHYLTVGLLNNGAGDQLGTQAFWQTDPDLDGGNDYTYQGVLEIFNVGPKPSYWLKIQKTPDGYRGFDSTNGSDWLEIMSILKNPETSDGYFSPEKIRLFQNGGFFHDGGTQAGSPVDFDFIHSASIPAPAIGYQDDEFNDATLNSQWRVNPGIGVGSIGLDAGDLVMTGGVYSNLWVDVEQPTYIFQDAPTSASYALTIKGQPTDMTAIPYELFNSYGIWLWHDQSNWMFISNQRRDTGVDPFDPTNGIEAAVKRDGLYDSYGTSFGTDPCPEYLRVRKDGGQALVQYSYDNSTWTDVQFDIGGTPTSSFSIGSDNLQVRLFTKRVFGDGDDQAVGIQNPPLDAQIDWIRSAELPPAGVNDWQLY